MRLLAFIFVVSLAGSACAEPACFRSMAGAAAQRGIRSSEGYRLETSRFDPFLHASWATVVSCSHPERPAYVVLEAITSPERSQDEANARSAGGQAAQPVVRPGSTVRLLIRENDVQLEVAGVAQTNAAIGDSVKVRLTPFGEGSEARFAVGIVRSADLVEVLR